LNNSDETVTLLSPNEKVVDSYSYSKTFKGFSFSLDLKDMTWHKTFDITKGLKNVFSIQKEYPNLIISELFPNPKNNEKTNEFIEIYNPNNFEVSLKNWGLRDSSKSGYFVIKKDKILKPFEYFAIYRKDFKFALNNSGGETVSLFAPNENKKSSVSYDSAKKDISYGWTGHAWRFSKFLTPNKKNIFGTKLLIKKIDVDKKIYKNVKAKFFVKTNLNSSNLKYRWDFGDGKKSYKNNTTHTYKKSGIYKCSVKISNDIEEIVKFFNVEVKNYPSYNINIIEISPNPEGKDFGNEYIIIENKSKKTVRFNNWSIATGKNKKHLINHLIKKKFKLKPGKTKKIYAKYSAISLPNKGGVVELRSPDGKIVYRKKYKYTKKTMIPSGAIYKKVKENWQWQISVQKDKSKNKKELTNLVSNKILSEALANDNKKITQAIVNEKSVSDNVGIKNKNNLFDKIFKYINSLLSKLNKYISGNNTENNLKKIDKINIKSNPSKNYLPNKSLNFFK